MINLTNCDREQIKTPGSIQNFGALLVTDDKFKIIEVSENVSSFLNVDPAELLGKDVRGHLEHPGLIVEMNEIEGRRIYSFEKSTESQAGMIQREVRKAVDGLHKQNGWAPLLNEVSTIVRNLSGYDRVMIYRFHEDLHGEVVAESVREGVDSFLGLHYPASDIPLPARQVFWENWIRMIPDVHYIPSKLVPHSDTTPTNLGQTLLRSVSPIHIEYLKNMQVGASLTISIKAENRLWGLIACHHMTPKYLDPEWRGGLEDIGRLVSGMLGDVAQIEELKYRKKMRAVLEKLNTKIADSEDIAASLVMDSPNLLDFIDSTGASAALYLENQWQSIGGVPSKNFLHSLVGWLAENHSDRPVFFTNELPKIFPKAENEPAAVGLLAIAIPKSRHNYILLFRPEVVTTVRWAGNPEKSPDPSGNISPRKSFAEWRQNVRHTARPWKPWEIEGALELRADILSVDLRHQFQKEKEARAEAERAKTAREELMSVLSHDLKNPVSSIMLSLKVIEKISTLDDKVKSTLKRIERGAINMNNLINDILHVTKLEAGKLEIEKRSVSSSKILEEILDLLRPIAHENNLTIRLATDSEDLNVNVEETRIIQVLSNLIGNAIKFSPSQGVIGLKAKRYGPEMALFSVVDQGPGIAIENRKNVFDRFWQAKESNRLGTGLGLAISKGIVEAHGGEIWIESNPTGGSIFNFTLGLAPGE